MRNQDEARVVAGWTVSLGTIVASLGLSPVINGKSFDADDTAELAQGDVIERNFLAIGNALQALGNFGEAEAEEKYNLLKIGEEIQTAGNVTVLMSLFLDLIESEDLAFLLEAQGNLLQGFGAFLVALNEIEEQDPLGALGAMLQMSGNLLQAFGDIFLFQDWDTQPHRIIYLGSWVQALGAYLSALDITLDAKRKEKEMIYGKFSFEDAVFVYKKI